MQGETVININIETGNDDIDNDTKIEKAFKMNIEIQIDPAGLNIETPRYTIVIDTIVVGIANETGNSLSHEIPTDAVVVHDMTNDTGSNINIETALSSACDDNTDTPQQQQNMQALQHPHYQQQQPNPKPQQTE